MAKKITAIICGVSWALSLAVIHAFDPCNGGNSVLCGLSIVAMILGIFLLIVLAVLALIDYARRPR